MRVKGKFRSWSGRSKERSPRLRRFSVARSLQSGFPVGLGTGRWPPPRPFESTGDQDKNDPCPRSGPKLLLPSSFPPRPILRRNPRTRRRRCAAVATPRLPRDLASPSNSTCRGFKVIQKRTRKRRESSWQRSWRYRHEVVSRGRGLSVSVTPFLLRHEMHNTR